MYINSQISCCEDLTFCLKDEVIVNEKKTPPNDDNWLPGTRYLPQVMFVIMEFILLGVVFFSGKAYLTDLGEFRYLFIALIVLAFAVWFPFLVRPWEGIGKWR